MLSLTLAHSKCCAHVLCVSFCFVISVSLTLLVSEFVVRVAFHRGQREGTLMQATKPPTTIFFDSFDGDDV
jgi:hypothetical protein